jgi:hypothetical protein
MPYVADHFPARAKLLLELNSTIDKRGPVG